MPNWPDGTTDLLCPLCPERIWCSPEDPDASLSAMGNHLRWQHGAEGGDSRHLLARVKEVPSA